MSNTTRCIHCGEGLVFEQNPNGPEVWRSVEGPWGCLQAAFDAWEDYDGPDGDGEPDAPYPPHMPDFTPDWLVRKRNR